MDRQTSCHGIVRAMHTRRAVKTVHATCIWHVGTMHDLEDTIYSPRVKCGSQRNHWLLTAFSPREDHQRALAAAIQRVPPDWKQPIGRPSHTWFHAIEADLAPLNFGLATAWRKATTRDEWWHIVNTATLQWSMLWKKKNFWGQSQARSRPGPSRPRTRSYKLASRRPKAKAWPWGLHH